MGIKDWFNLSEHKNTVDKLSDVLPWHCLISPSVLLNKDGSLMSIIKFHGIDLGSATPNEMLSAVGSLNHILKRFGNGQWTVYVESQRKKCQVHPERAFPSIVTQMIDDERKQYFNSGQLFENEYYFTFQFLPPSDKENKVVDWFIEREEAVIKHKFDSHIKSFVQEMTHILGFLKDIFYSVELLTEGKLLTYLHACISDRPELKIADPFQNNQMPVELDYILVDSPFLGGYEPMLGKKHMRVISIKDFPIKSMPGYFDALNKLDIEYRWCTRFICLDKYSALKELENYRKKFFAARTTIMSYLRQVFSGGQDVGLENLDAIAKGEDVEGAISVIEDDSAISGYYTKAIILTDENLSTLEKKVEKVQRVIANLGFATYCETQNSVEAWLGSIPGNSRYNIRRPLFNSLNLCHLLPISGVWAGQHVNKHLNSWPLIYTRTSGSTPFRLSLHYGDVGHTTIIGPTGAGKSTHLALIAAQFAAYPDAQVYFFDKDSSCRVLTEGVGGNFFNLGAEDEEMSFQPLARIDEAQELAWAVTWLVDIFEAEGIDNGRATADTKNKLRQALESLATSPVKQRTMSGLQTIIQAYDTNLSNALEQFTVKGPYGQILDSDNDTLSYSRWQAFEMGHLMNLKGVCSHVLSYLFHRLEVDRLNGAPTIFILDECWLFFQNDQFREKMSEWLRVFRKKNASVVLATQSLADVVNSPILPAIKESCYSRIYLPNPNAREQGTIEIYKSFGLNQTEIDIISSAKPKREYYFKSPEGSRLYDLSMGEIALCWAAASSKEDQHLATELLKKYSKEEFPYHWYKSRGLNDAANIYISQLLKNAG